ncbi:MAG: hypothetical protein R3185_02015, partial [Candidatus Thermoplasmatota archaeon]|nr:hypothetical protein [Candidatus Thermoplasmatota archaeon]
EQIQQWYYDYGVTVWAVETNLYRGGIIEDEILREFCQTNGITLVPHNTQKNKWDRELGVSRLADWMAKDLVDIPWGDAETRAKFREYRKQCINFSKDAQAHNRRSALKSDLVMASWFPEEVMQKWRREWLRAQNRTPSRIDGYPFAPMADPFAA